MSYVTLEDIRPRTLLEKYGLGVLLAANVFGAGSVYILSNTGANFGFALLWVFPMMLVVDMVMHDMSARLAVRDRPLMHYLREEVLGDKFSPWFAVGISLIMSLWGVANYAVSGFAFSWLLGVDPFLCIAAMASAGMFFVELRLYDRIEAVITTLVFVVFGSYVFLLLGVDIPTSQVAKGFVPKLVSDVGYMTMIISLLGTTVYYPNFFIQSSMYPTKGWSDLRKYRKDNFVGILSTIALSAVVVVVSAVVLSPGALSLTAPGQPLTAVLGPSAMTVFMVAVWLAAFTSATGTLFGAAFMIPQSYGRDTTFGDMHFRFTANRLISLSFIVAIAILHYTNMTPVEMAITMPAVNGVIGLPITVLALWGAVNKYSEVSRAENILFGIVSAILLIGSLLTAQSLTETIISFLA